MCSSYYDKVFKPQQQHHGPPVPSCGDTTLLSPLCLYKYCSPLFIMRQNHCYLFQNPQFFFWQSYNISESAMWYWEYTLTFFLLRIALRWKWEFQCMFWIIILLEDYEFSFAQPQVLENACSLLQCKSNNWIIPRLNVGCMHLSTFHAVVSTQALHARLQGSSLIHL